MGSSIESASRIGARSTEQAYQLTSQEASAEVIVDYKGQEIIRRHRRVAVTKERIDFSGLCREFYLSAEKLFGCLHQGILREGFCFLSEQIIELTPGKLEDLAAADFSEWKSYSIRVRLLGHDQRRALFRAVLFTDRQIYELPFYLEF
ncbi:MAG TPA: hypothetical protein PK619_01030 [bacterium]|nr:hypothetical protein [bacterium]HPN81009.1 hypothetical protein [bacterium]HPW39292.1 hypothetical protein [bacterium]HQA63789.1 hypothetical protein [bacterium]